MLWMLGNKHKLAVQGDSMYQHVFIHLFFCFAYPMDWACVAHYFSELLLTMLSPMHSECTQ